MNSVVIISILVVILVAGVGMFWVKRNKSSQATQENLYLDKVNPRSIIRTTGSKDELVIPIEMLPDDTSIAEKAWLKLLIRKYWQGLIS